MSVTIDKVKRNGKKMRHSAVRYFVIISVIVITIGCGSPTGPRGGGAGGADAPDPQAAFTAEVEAVTPPSDVSTAAEVYAYAIAVVTLADVYSVSDDYVSEVVTGQIPDEPTRANVLGVISGSLTLQDLMVQDTGVYEDPEEQIVVGLPFTEEIPADSPIQVNGTPTIVDDGVRTGMEFDSAEDYLIIPAAPSNDLTHDGTIEAWLKPTTNVRWAGIVHKGTNIDWSDEGYSFQYDGNRRLMLAMTSAGGQLVLVRTNHVLTEHSWSHVVVTWNSDSAHIYVDGTDVVTQITAGFTSTQTTIAENYPFKSSDGDVVVGTQIPGNSWRFNGVMSDVRVFDRYMEPSEVLERLGGS